MKGHCLLVLTTIVATTALSQYSDDIAHRQGKFGITAKAGPAIPVSEFGELFKMGFTGFVEVPYNLTEEFQVYVGLGLSHFNVDNDGLSNSVKEETESQNVTTNVEAPYQVIPLVVGLNFSYRYKNFWPYFTFSFGMYFQKLESSGSYTISGVSTTLAPKTQTWNQSAYAFGVGSLIPIGDEGWAIDVNAKFNSVVDYEGRVLITTPSGDDVTTRAIRYVSVLAGLSYTFH